MDVAHIVDIADIANIVDIVDIAAGVNIADIVILYGYWRYCPYCIYIYILLWI